jgi:hypothetical protein
VTRDHRRDIFTLAGIAALGSLLIASLFAKGPRVVHDPLTAIPTSSFIVANIDVGALAKSPLGAALAGEKGAHAGAFFGVDSIQSVCGFDPLPHVQGIALSVPEGDTHGELGISVTGDLSKKTLLSCAKAIIEKRGGTWSLRESSSYSIVSENKEHGAEIAFRDGGPFLIGRGEWLERMIDAADGRAPSMAVASDDLHHTLRADLARTDPTADAIVVSVVLPRGLRDRIGNEMFAAPDAGDANSNATMQGVLEVSGVALAIHAGTEHEDARILGEIQCDGDAATAETACKKVESFLLHERLEWSGNMRFRLFGLGGLIDGLQTKVSGGLLTFKTHTEANTLARMLSRLLDAPPHPVAGSASAAPKNRVP